MFYRHTSQNEGMISTQSRASGAQVEILHRLTISMEREQTKPQE